VHVIVITGNIVPWTCVLLVNISHKVATTLVKLLISNSECVNE